MNTFNFISSRSIKAKKEEMVKPEVVLHGRFADICLMYTIFRAVTFIIQTTACN